MSGKKISSQDKELFCKAMSDVEPIKKNKKRSTRQIKSPSQGIKYGEKKKLVSMSQRNNRYLSDHVSIPIFDNTILDYQRNHLPPKQVKKLKSGNIFYQGKLDLHGFRADEAKSKLLQYLDKARQDGVRCILIIHGKGGYEGEPPRIKNLVNVWLRQIPEILAFHSAIAKDGGTGALYVLLKR